MAPPKDAQHRDAADKGRHILERRQKRLDVIGDLFAAITSIEIANANAASIKVSSRVIAIPRNRNPRSRGNASRLSGSADAISSWRSLIWTS